jgi:hypothetical protein
MFELMTLTYIGELSLFGFLVVILLAALGFDKRDRLKPSEHTR